MPNPRYKCVSTSVSELAGQQNWLDLSNLLHHCSIFFLVYPFYIGDNLINRGAQLLLKPLLLLFNLGK